MARINGTPGQLETWSELHSLIGLQSWRVAHFRVAADDINYRRFFNINDLAGLRMELPEVFEHTHGFVLSLLSSGTLDGLRIDHIDGLLDPKGYLRRLREKAGPDFYLIVEKILAAHEALRPDWPFRALPGTSSPIWSLASSSTPQASRVSTRRTGASRESGAPFPRSCTLANCASWPTKWPVN